MAKRLILIHGRSFKPARDVLEASWLDAVAHGIERDCDAATAEAYRSVEKDFVYYGDVSNRFLRRAGHDYDEAQDVEDRAACLEKLKSYDREDFLSDRGEARYENLPGKTSLAEFFADTLGEALAVFRLSEPLIAKVAPDVQRYWDPDTAFGSDVRWSLTEKLAAALRNDDDVLLMAHSLGTMISFDVLWKFSHYGEYRDIRDRKVSRWITLGAPLADETVKRRLKGSGASGERKYPHNVKCWFNVGAEDDYISHDETVADDWAKMRRHTSIDHLEDYAVYNLSVRNGRSNPHHGTGYLIHPTVTQLIADWVGG